MARVIMPALEDTIGKVAPFLVDWIVQITPLLADLAVAFLQFIGALASQAGPKIIQWFQTLIGMVIRIFGASEQGIPLFIKYLDLLIEKLPMILEAAIRFLPTLVDLFGSFLDNVAQFIDVYLPMLVEWITEALKVARKIVDETLPTLIEVLQKAAPLIADMVRAFLDGISKALDLVQKLADKWSTVIEPALKAIIQAVRDIIKSIVGLTIAWIDLLPIVTAVFQVVASLILMLMGGEGIALAQRLARFIKAILAPLREIKRSLGEVRDAMNDVGGALSPPANGAPNPAPMNPNAFAPRSAQGGVRVVNSDGSPSLLPAQAAENVNTAAMAKERRAAALRGRGSVDLGFGERLFA
jgi:phage-related protein